ncbi:MAG: peptidase S41, partial [Burkholderiales bacterium]|nr:peptidase S41 [Burkholderiales bacterium]
YGFIQTNNCNTAYFAIQFSGVNALGKGDYTNGFAPKCAVADDLDHPLGDANESRLSAALKYAQTGTCPVASFKTNPPPANSHVKPERDPYPWRRIRLIK